MNNPMKTTLSISAICLMVIGSAYSAEKSKVRIIDRRNSETSYSYFVPEQAYANSNANVSCFGSGGNVNCSTARDPSTPLHLLSLPTLSDIQ